MRDEKKYNLPANRPVTYFRKIAPRNGGMYGNNDVIKNEYFQKEALD